LVKSGLSVEKEKPLPLVYEEVKLDCGYRMDPFIEKRIVVEVKSVDALTNIHLAQVLPSRQDQTSYKRIMTLL